MFTTAALAETAALVGDPRRAAMLIGPLGGRARHGIFSVFRSGSGSRAGAGLLPAVPRLERAAAAYRRDARRQARGALLCAQLDPPGPRIARRRGDAGG